MSEGVRASPVVPLGPGPARGAAPGARVYARVGPELFRDLRASAYRKIVLQVPAGLTRDFAKLGEEIREATGARVVHVARACFGACDPPSPREAPGAEAIVTLGHAPIPNMPLALPTYFVEMRTSEGDVERMAEAVEKAGLPKHLGIVSSVQHLDILPRFRDALSRRSFETYVGEGDRRLAYPGQALGCNYTTAESIAEKSEGVLFLGTGLFHPLGLAFAVDRPVWALDPLQVEISPPLDRDRMVAKRLMTIARAMDAKRWGVLASSFGGQDRRGMALSLVEKARAKGRSAEILLFDRLDPRDLMGRDLDAYVCTACPRIALDDAESYDRPMLTAPEFLSAIGERPLTPYRFDTFH
ncbi:MAG: diphthamide biosynthesis enzyme Dph2 [Euryarchaeota archaeon]|nr:diphthamide biosynthesis enzyme Dph2 [Euryarchaeota archaeon]MDE1837813.1 diphthamide biosynthesis enzyme Dph2 [Euryarchaeota archaeon]MDE1880087.1 diphthamide biosynthesis enzyme Dph2 [Euryarchaeota archaeon]MDE2045075.1 diphthamide biosynthesis enzyme Dph2 [Thermoplasmata archaeon]